MIRIPTRVLITLGLLGLPGLAVADNLKTRTTNNYGTPGGLIDMPTAESAPDGELTTNVTYWFLSRDVEFSDYRPAFR